MLVVYIFIKHKIIYFTNRKQSLFLQKASEIGVKIMNTAWVDAVWKASLNKNVHCNNQMFKTYYLKPFHKLIVSCTGFTNVSERQQLEKLIQENGGSYKGTLNLHNTDVLICNG